MRRFVVGTVFVLFALGPQPALGNALQEPAIKEVLAMSEAGVGEAVILARLEQLDALPELTGEEIALLKKRGVPDRVLLRLVELGGGAAKDAESPAAPVPEAAPRVPVPVLEGPASGEEEVAPALLIVEFESFFPITWLEVHVDGERLSRQGELPTGESEPGGFLKWPARMHFRESRRVLESEVEPGEHSIQIAYAVTEVEADPDDEWSEFSRQRYSSAGIWVSGERPEGRWTETDAVSCSPAAGQVCHITARAGRKTAKRLGGPEVYQLSYQVSTKAQP